MTDTLTTLQQSMSNQPCLQPFTLSAPQSHAFLAPFSLLRFEQIGVQPQHVADRSLAPHPHVFLSPASLRRRVLHDAVVVVEALTPQRHVLLAPPSLVLATEIRRRLLAPRSLLRLEPRQ